jgi:hypothetical protein
MAARIVSVSRQINNINKQYVDLKPHTTYTLTAWIRAENAVGSPGAQVYPYEFEEADTAGPAISVAGTSGWTRYRHVFTTAQDGHGRINFRLYGATGAAWFDDLELTEGAVYTETVFARDFTKGLVLVRPNSGGGYGDDTASQVVLPRLLRALSADGIPSGPVRQIRLRNAEAAILVE